MDSFHQWDAQVEAVNLIFVKCKIEKKSCSIPREISTVKGKKKLDAHLNPMQGVTAV